jgi:hypothetical protein
MRPFFQTRSLAADGSGAEGSDGDLALAERILPRASDLWVQASLDYKQPLQQLFFPEGIVRDGNRFDRTATAAAFHPLGAV